MLPDGSVCHYLCDAGYTIPPAQEHLIKVRCVAGSWDSDQDPICLGKTKVLGSTATLGYSNY